MTEIPFVLYASKSSPVAIAPTLSLGELLARHQEWPQKDGTPFSCVQLDTPYRNNLNVNAVTAYIADLDHLRDFSDIASLLEPYEYWAWTTYSHTQEQPRFRVVVVLSRPVLRQDWPRVWRNVNAALFDGLVDPSTKDASRCHYLPSHAPGAPHWIVHHAGAALDPDSLPDVDEKSFRSLQTRSAKRVGTTPSALKGTHGELVRAALQRLRGGDTEAQALAWCLEHVRELSLTGRAIPEHELRGAVRWAARKLASAPSPQSSRPPTPSPESLAELTALGFYSPLVPTTSHLVPYFDDHRRAWDWKVTSYADFDAYRAKVRTVKLARDAETSPHPTVRIVPELAQETFDAAPGPIAVARRCRDQNGQEKLLMPPLPIPKHFPLTYVVPVDIGDDLDHAELLLPRKAALLREAASDILAPRYILPHCPRPALDGRACGAPASHAFGVSTRDFNDAVNLQYKVAQVLRANSLWLSSSKGPFRLWALETPTPTGHQRKITSLTRSEIEKDLYEVFGAPDRKDPSGKRLKGSRGLLTRAVRRWNDLHRGHTTIRFSFPHPQKVLTLFLTDAPPSIIQDNHPLGSPNPYTLLATFAPIPDGVTSVVEFLRPLLQAICGHIPAISETFNDLLLNHGALKHRQLLVTTGPARELRIRFPKDSKCPHAVVHDTRAEGLASVDAPEEIPPCSKNDRGLETMKVHRHWVGRASRRFPALTSAIQETAHRCRGCNPRFSRRLIPAPAPPG